MRARQVGHRLVVEFGDRTVCWYRGAELERFWRRDDPGQDTAFAVGIGAGPDTIDAVGPYRLRADGSVVSADEATAPLPFHPRTLTISPAGTLAVGRNSFRDLGRGVDVTLQTTDAGCAAVALGDGYVVAIPWGGDHGTLQRLGREGQVRQTRELGTPIRALVALPDERLLAVTEGEDGRVGWVDPVTLAFTPRGRRFDWDISCAAVAVPGGAVFVSMRRAIRVLVDGDAFSIEVLLAPVGDPTSVFGPIRWPDARLVFRGPPGPFDLETTSANTGASHRTGLVVVVEVEGPVKVDRVSLGEHSAGIHDGRGSLPMVKVAHGADVSVRIVGHAAGPGAAVVRLVAVLTPDPLRRLAKVEQVACTLAIELQVEAGLVAVRGAVRLVLDPSWVADLHRAGALDVQTAAPDLDRWRRRAVARLRAQDPDDPSVQRLFLELSAADRSQAGAEGRVASWKLASGEDWTVGASEAAAIGRALGDGHPFGRFAAAGGFTVTTCGSGLGPG